MTKSKSPLDADKQKKHLDKAERRLLKEQEKKPYIAPKSKGKR